jgi:hypothetical protein
VGYRNILATVEGLVVHLKGLHKLKYLDPEGTAVSDSDVNKLRC